jgi:hypothetical protein
MTQSDNSVILAVTTRYMMRYILEISGEGYKARSQRVIQLSWYFWPATKLYYCYIIMTRWLSLYMLLLVTWTEEYIVNKLSQD